MKDIILLLINGSWVVASEYDYVIYSRADYILIVSSLGCEPQLEVLKNRYGPTGTISSKPTHP